MDLESKCSGFQAVEENQANKDKSPLNDEIWTNNNGPCVNGIFDLCSHEKSDAKTSSTDQRGKLVHVASEKPVNIIGTSLCGGSPPTTKGYGLKKWRRIKRNIVKDPNTYVDSSKILKRGLSGAANSTKHPQRFPLDINQNSEGSIGSSTTLKNAGFTDDFVICGSNSDSRYAFGSTFAVGTDSESSEDRSSKSSTAASVPKSRYDLPASLGYLQEKNQTKNMSTNNSSNSTQRVQQGRGGTESTKKPRGERGKMEKENSQSSIDSDSRSSNVKGGVFTVTGNKKHSETSIIYDGGNGEEAHTNEHFLKQAQAACCKEKEGESEDHFQNNGGTNLSWNVKEERSENNQSSAVDDPLFESICGLRSLQEALEEEVHKLGQIGNESHSPDDITAVDVEGIKQSAPCSLELQILNLRENINVLECKLEESQGKLGLRDSRITELEAILSTGGSHEKRAGNSVGLQEEKDKETESELEDFFRQKIEEEIKCLAIKNMMQNLKVARGLQLKLVEEQETLSEKQAEVVNKFGEAGSKALVLKNEAEQLEKYCGDVSLVEETLKMQKRVCNVAFSLFIQVMLLILVLWFVLSQLSFNSGLVVPT